MWDDIIIGEGRIFNSAVRVFAIKGNENISENQSAYWISDCILGFGIKIYKNTDEGAVITKMIAEETPLKKIQHYIDSIVIKHATIEDILIRIKEKEEDAFEEGKKTKTKEIQYAIGLRL